MICWNGSVQTEIAEEFLFWFLGVSTTSSPTNVRSLALRCRSYFPTKYHPFINSSTTVDEEGIFRLSGAATEIQKLRESFDRGMNLFSPPSGAAVIASNALFSK
jgi:hypothetical protein